MTEKPKAKWGDLLALGVGTGLIAYFTKIRGNPKYEGPSSETWLDAALIIVPVVLVLGVATYFLGRLLGVIGDWIRSRWAGKQ